jgi:hypothetical protein
VDPILLAIVTSTQAEVLANAQSILPVVWPVAIGFAVLYFGYRVLRAALAGRA